MYTFKVISLSLLLFASFFAFKIDGMEKPVNLIKKPVLFVIMPGNLDGGLEYLADPKNKSPLDFSDSLEMVRSPISLAKSGLTAFWSRYHTAYDGGEPRPMRAIYNPFDPRSLAEGEQRFPTEAVIANLPIKRMDLGQKNCQEFYDQLVLKHIDQYDEVVLGGGSQGSVAPLLFILKHKDEPKIIKKIIGVTIEACLGSANFTINSKGPAFIRDNCYVLAPFIAEIIGLLPIVPGLACYDACGPQLINIVEEIGKSESLQNIPITIFHSKQDPVIPVEVARGVVGGLAKGGHKRVYYLENPGKEHIHLINPNVLYDMLMFSSILNPHTIKSFKTYNPSSNVKTFTPEICRIHKKLQKTDAMDGVGYDYFEKIYDEIIKKEEAFQKRSKHALLAIRWTIRVIVGLLILIPSLVIIKKLIIPLCSYLLRKCRPRFI
jgi:hypothetical protein